MSGTIDINTTQQRKNQDRLKRISLSHKNGISDQDFLDRLYMSKNLNELSTCSICDKLLPHKVYTGPKPLEKNENRLLSLY